MAVNMFNVSDIGRRWRRHGARLAFRFYVLIFRSTGRQLLLEGQNQQPGHDERERQIDPCAHKRAGRLLNPAGLETGNARLEISSSQVFVP